MYSFIRIVSIFNDHGTNFIIRFPEMRKFALATVASIDDRANLEKHFGGLKTETLQDIAEYLFLVKS